MARVLADGTGAEWAQVWLASAGGSRWRRHGHRAATRRLAARRRPGRTRRHGRGRQRPAVAPRARGGELLGVLVCRSAGTAAVLGRGAAVRRLADQAGPVLRGARLRAELEPAAGELSARAEELRTSRAAAGRGAGRRAPDPRAQHPRRRPAAPGRPGREPAARRDPVATFARTGRALLAEQERAARRGDRGAAGRCRAGIYPPLLGADGLVACTERRRRRPARSRSRSVPAESAGTPPRSRRRRTSAAWRPCRTPPSTRGDRHPRLARRT